MNIVVFASDNKGVSILKNVCNEIKNRKHNYFFLFSDENQLQYPHKGLDKFYYDSNCDFDNSVVSHTLNCHLPFKPDILIIQRERWQPEQSIIHEFKQSFNAKVYVVEVSSHITNNIENRLEMISRNNHPQSMVDGFFEHSEFAKQRRVDCLYPEWGEKSIVVGNPRFDLLEDIDEERCIKKYNIDETKKQILFWGVQNTTRKKTLELLQNLSTFTKNDYQIFYKCYPGEPYNELFKHQFNPFIVSGVEVIYDNLDINTMSKLCDIHIGAVTSVYNYGFYFDKKIVNLNSVCDIQEYMNDMKRYENETKDGVEDSAQFWMNIHKLKTIDEFKEFVDMDRLEKFKETNEYVMDLARECINDYDLDYKFLTDEIKPRDKFIKLFDEFNDRKASERILDYLQEEV